MKKPNQESTAIHPFQRLQGELATLIQETPAGERLPAEPELAHRLGVSRATLREAMRSFEGQGLIRRRQGVGTFVVAHKQVIESGLEELKSIETLARSIGLHVEMGDVYIEEINADSVQAERLNVAENDRLVQVTRIICAENRPVAYLIDVLPVDVLSASNLSEGFTGSVLDLLLKRGAPAVANSIAEIQAVAASPEIARALQIQRGDVLLLLVARLFAASGKVIDFSHSYFLPGFFKFHVVRKVGQPLFSNHAAIKNNSDV
jgi:GntR family transcriptional regulator